MQDKVGVDGWDVSQFAMISQRMIPPQQRGYVSSGLPPNLIWPGNLIRASQCEEGKSDHVCFSQLD